MVESESCFQKVLHVVSIPGWFPGHMIKGNRRDVVSAPGTALARSHTEYLLRRHRITTHPVPAPSPRGGATLPRVAGQPFPAWRGNPSPRGGATLPRVAEQPFPAWRGTLPRVAGLHGPYAFVIIQYSVG